jgi:uncharacterized membrane protein YgdD (TMEM256/DUF423 family)
MNRTMIGLGAALAGLSVALGAFGAHGLKERFVEGGEAWWQTGSHYMMFHALAIIIAGFWGKSRAVPGLFAAGMVFFSGSLFAMALGAPRWFGAITPLGGASFMIGWGVFAWSALAPPTDQNVAP